MTVRVNVTPRTDVRSPEGEVVTEALRKLGFEGVTGVRIGNYYELTLVEGTPESEITEMCKRKLANPLIQDFVFEVVT